MPHKELLPLIFCIVDDFCKKFEPYYKNQLKKEGSMMRDRKSQMTLSEDLTVVIFYQFSGIKNFKIFFNAFKENFISEFPKLCSYNRFIEKKQRLLFPLYALSQCVKGECSGVSFIDATALPVCHNKRIYSHKVFKEIAQRGKTTMGYFYGFKLHLVVNHTGQIIDYSLSSGEVPDINKAFDLLKNLWGSAYADKGYVSSKIFENLRLLNMNFMTYLKKNMKNVKDKLVPFQDAINLRNRGGVVENTIKALKLKYSIWQTRSRSVANYFVNIFGSICAHGLGYKFGF
jgi:hypothetical protein